MQDHISYTTEHMNSLKALCSGQQSPPEIFVVVINVIFEIKIHFNLRNMLKNKTKCRKLGVLCPLCKCRVYKAFYKRAYSMRFIKRRPFFCKVKGKQ